ncbi:acid phosphatase type 7-like [Oratosquilla oratoria]|uniref:acid phosphatase type 7-like n=1 Tax=Oratosquilla oratoria TaxID=337810 RepID=UPI003F76B74D
MVRPTPRTSTSMVPLLLLGILVGTARGFAPRGARVKDWQPQQVHLALGETIDEIVVTWVTPDLPSEAVMVEYGRLDLDLIAYGNSTMFKDGGSLGRTFWIHRVHLRGLHQDTRYFYHAGSEFGWSPLYTFKTQEEGNDHPVRLAIFGDLGAVNPQSLSRLQEETQRGMYDAILHVGDLAYNLDTDNAEVGDIFMRQIEPVSAYLPYMTCPGNHENAYNFSNYRARFSMPNYRDTESYFYSFNMGPVHFIAISTESYYFTNYGYVPLQRQYEWLVKDLEEATRPEVRAERPWILLFGHRPMYCSNRDSDDCTRVNCKTRVGLDANGTFGMEPLLDHYGVDLAIWAHEHSYERLWPVYNNTILNGSMTEPYTNPRGPVHVTTGSAGCQEFLDPFVKDPPKWSAVRASDYGYMRMTVFNHTHLYFEQVSDDQGGKIVDSVLIRRDTHEPYAAIRAKTSKK